MIDQGSVSGHRRFRSRFLRCPAGLSERDDGQ
jgi:hypothetical protein